MLFRSAGLPDLQRAMTATHNARLDALTQARIDVDIYERALEVVTTKGAQATTSIGAVPATPVALRDRLETAYRRLAVLEPESPVRVQLVEKANRTRKWSLL